ncbi:MAG: PorT family protein [Marinifilaceae bacterium]|jgi:hypothetical protein|nr:PorT family protein [Marinifilaceae bacterium]
MKKIFLSLFICVIAFTASAQLASPISLGVHAGWASTKINVSDLSLGGIKSSVKESASGGYMMGVFARINLGKLYIQPALDYSVKKGKIEIPTSQIAGAKMIASDLEYSSIDIPILLGYKIIKLPFMNIHVYAGPVASFSTKKLSLTDAKFKTLDDAIDPDRAIWNIKLGAGVEIWKLNIDFDYEKGLKNFSKDFKAPEIFNITIGLRII